MPIQSASNPRSISSTSNVIVVLRLKISGYGIQAYGVWVQCGTEATQLLILKFIEEKMCVKRTMDERQMGWSRRWIEFIKSNRQLSTSRYKKYFALFDTNEAGD